MHDEHRAAPPHIDVWALCVDDPAEDSATLAALLSDDERLRAARFVSPQLRTRWAVTRGWLRRTLSSYVGIAPAALTFDYSARGKPGLVGLQFNLSHSADHALLAVSATAVPGIDIEQIRAMDDQNVIIERFYHASEAAALFAMPAPEREAAFFQLWSLKESCMKAIGSGLAIEPTEIVFEMPVAPVPRLLALRDETDPSAWHFLILPEFAGFSAALGYCGRKHEVRRRYR